MTQVNQRARDLLGLKDTVPFPASNLPRERGLREAIGAALSGQRRRCARGADRRTRARAHGTAAARRWARLSRCSTSPPVRRLETVRRDFVANASHELRTPLTVIGGFAETLLDDSLPNEQRRQFAQTVLAQHAADAAHRRRPAGPLAHRVGRLETEPGARRRRARLRPRRWRRPSSVVRTNP